MRRYILMTAALLLSLSLSAQVDRHDVRSGNRKFRKGDYAKSEIDYRKAVVKDSLSLAGEYNLASALYRLEEYDGAQKAMDAISEVAPASAHAADYFFNKGDIALQKKDYGAAMEAFKQALLINPSDMAAKENYIYAKLMKKDEDQNGGGQNNDQNQDNNDQQNNDQQNNDQNQDQNKNDDQQNKDQNQNPEQNQDQGGQDQPQQSSISPQQAQQMLQAIQAKEKETQDKVKKEKADLLQSRQKEKNW